MISVIEIPAWLVLLKDWLEIIGFFLLAVIAIYKPARTIVLNFFQKSVREPDNINKKEIERIGSRQKLLEQGMKAVLGSHIFEKSQAYIKHGSISPKEMEDITRLFESYQSLNGNGTTEKLYSECKALPTRTE